MLGAWSRTTYVVYVKQFETGFQKVDILTQSLGALPFTSNRLIYLLGE